MLLDEEPATLIHNCIENFNINPDKQCIKRTRDALTHLHSTRSQILQRNRAALAQLNRSLSTIQSTNALSASSHNAAAHSAEILRLDTEKFRIAKEAQDAEIEVERLSKDISSSQRQIEESETFADEGGAAGREARDDEAVLKLKVYRMLGIDVEPDPETGVYSKATVRSRERGDVRVVNVDPKFSRFFYANYFWGAL